MTNLSFIQRAAKVHPVLILPAVGVAAWLAAGLVPGNGARPAQALPSRGAAAAPRSAALAAQPDTLPDRLPDSLSAALGAPAVSPQPNALSFGGGGTGGGSGGSDGGSSTGQSKHGAQAGHASPDAAREPHGLRHRPEQAGGRLGLRQPGFHQPGAQAGPRPMQALNRPQRAVYAAPPTHVAAAPTISFPFFGGGHFMQRGGGGGFGGGHFGGGGGRHR